MNHIEKYEFDRCGYLVLQGILPPDVVARLSQAVDELEEHALQHLDQPPRVQSRWFKNMDYHRSPDRGYHAVGAREPGSTLIIEDFWNADSAFHTLIYHQPTMAYIGEIVQERATINNSEIRIRYPGNATGSHMGGPASHKYRYSFTGGRIDCMMVRMVYFLHDVNIERGAFSVVPATHKSNYPTPYNTSDPDTEPGMIGLEASAGDAILFTENLRHGGLTNRSQVPRKTIHVGYGPPWMMSQNIATIDEPPYITDETRARLTDEQKLLFEPWPA
jgi:hypothetical protein